MHDAIACVASELDRVVPADVEVAGIERPPDVGSFEHRRDIARRLHEGADVRMQRLAQTELGADPVDLRQHADEVVPLGPGQLEPRRPAGVDHHRRDEHRAAGRGEELRGSADVGQRRGARAAGSWSTTGTKPPMNPIPYSDNTERSSAGSRGRNPGAPSSVATRPSERISDSTRSAGNITPQPGTSQTPHVIGAPARRLSMVIRAPDMHEIVRGPGRGAAGRKVLEPTNPAGRRRRTVGDGAERPHRRSSRRCRHQRHERLTPKENPMNRTIRRRLGATCFLATISFAGVASYASATTEPPVGTEPMGTESHGHGDDGHRGHG